MSLSYTVKKSKITISEQRGNMLIKYLIDTDNYRCPCGGHRSKLCDHIQYFFTSIVGLHSSYLRLLSVPFVANYFLNAKITDLWEGNLNRHCEKFISTTPCDICMEPLVDQTCISSDDRPYISQCISKCVQCNHCKWMFHNLCRLKWKGTCPRCNK